MRADIAAHNVTRNDEFLTRSYNISNELILVTNTCFSSNKVQKVSSAGLDDKGDDAVGPLNDDFLNKESLELHQITEYYIKNRENLKFAHLNINSLRYKFAPLVAVLNRSMLDVLSLQETKLDDTFTNAQFSVKGFKLHRKDYHGNSGGLMMFIGDDIAQRRRHDIESVSVKSGRIEIIIVEIVINKEK